MRLPVLSPKRSFHSGNRHTVTQIRKIEHDRRDFGIDDLIYAGSLYLGIDTPLGPVFLGYGRSNEDRSAVYLNFGSLIRPRQEF